MDIDNRDENRTSTGGGQHPLPPSFPQAVVTWMLPANVVTASLPRRVLDLAAGDGRFTGSLLRHGLEVVAVEESEELLAVLRADHPSVEAHVGTYEAIPLPDDSVDEVVVGQAWHLMDPVVAGREIARVLRPGGILAMAWNTRVPSADWTDEFADVQDVPRDLRLGADTDGVDRPHPGEPFLPYEVLEMDWVLPPTGDAVREVNCHTEAWRTRLA